MRQEFYARLGDAIRKQRDSLGVSQAGLAAKIGVGRTTITMIERGSQAVLAHQLVDIAHALKSSIDELLPESQVSSSTLSEAVPSVSSEMAELLSGLDQRVGRITR